MASAAHRLPKVFVNTDCIPFFLCPLLRKFSGISLRKKRSEACTPKTQKRKYQLTAVAVPSSDLPVSPNLLALPRSCPGCGAFTQTVNPDHVGFYSTTRKSVKAYLAQHGRTLDKGCLGEAGTFDEIVGHADQSLLAKLGLDGSIDITNASIPQVEVPMPVCNRCHDLLHHHLGLPIHHPTIQSIQDIISESPYKYNHVYHVLDAADFPLSVVPQLQRHLELTPQRSQNRRAKTIKFYHGRMAEMSFIITRSDLLAPRKEQVDHLMPYLIEVLRDALGSSGKNVRLGNVRCVSSKRGWWTKQIKEDIWNRGGGGWMVGKVNVGKSNLFENVFPKGRDESVNFQGLRHAAGQGTAKPDAGVSQDSGASRTSQDGLALETDSLSDEANDELLEDTLLPPAPLEQRFPVMPTVSSLPGTTVSPIRLLFGGGKGELIDLPGLSRGNLEDHVSDGHKLDLVMRHRIKPEQFVIKPGQSLLLGGLIRIMPSTPELTILAYPFVPLKAHITSTEKAIAIQIQEEPSGVPIITKPGVGKKMASAGSFQLKWDVTKQRAGPLTAPAAVGLHTKVLPFVIFSTDILIEGCGWVEIVAQVRRRTMEAQADAAPTNVVEESPFPTIEIFSPEGKHIGARRPMNAWLLGGANSVPASKRTARPRRSMKGVKKELKKAKRAASVD